MHNFVNVLYMFCSSFDRLCTQFRWFFVYVLLLNVVFVTFGNLKKIGHWIMVDGKYYASFLLKIICALYLQKKFLSKKMELTWFYIHRWVDIKFPLVNWRYSYRLLTKPHSEFGTFWQKTTKNRNFQTKISLLIHKVVLKEIPLGRNVTWEPSKNY